MKLPSKSVIKETLQLTMHQKKIEYKTHANLEMLNKIPKKKKKFGNQIKGNINKLIDMDVTIGLIKCPHKGNVTMHQKKNRI